MKLGIAVDPSAMKRGDLARCAQLVDDSALDLLWLEATSDRTAAVVAAAASLAGTTERVTIGGRLHLDNSHPVYTAEECAVLDNLLGGRWIASLAPAPGHEASFDEAAHIVLKAARSRPFAHRGVVWTVPARIHANTHAQDDAVMVTPSRVRSDGTWIQADSAEDLGAPYLADNSAPRGRGLRPAVFDVESVDGRDAITRVVEKLRAAGRDDGVDTAILRVPAVNASNAAFVIDKIAGRIRAAVQLPGLPAGLEQFWDRHNSDEELVSIDV
ncbi:LLM class flavin-dependent oxidoreductase [Rhodococcus sp. 05-2256-B2]|uniref:LLM class flavin-dependent oxidoreductase n=1 Tax=Nocardiaceae TaxID=85025 RepID=UPI00050BE68E|nr:MULTISPECIES: LLM class flavin-dependent oxidoreductase [Rhodococcus]OZD87640.1 LLM class flavin-dependent oxidoreductase [Rhodococcus sp. 05-2256-B4]OZD89905.1 LLM class flavin-dependent oxidoreductase [Rhodococcus sp. 05-2256-B2]OZD92223.1 LLM class flavin-dependent oxidoreductase [Rhodococcus sp. 05-2256-B3]OZD98928.1 LLM class flavin-dependent oxidoreductase [Rhodococcus sp. 05-2256-B1]